MTPKNRLQERISSIQARIDGGDIPQEKLDELEKNLSTSTSDLIEYQNVQALAHASGKISFEEADMVFNLLGRNAPSQEKWDRLSMAERVALTQMMAELLDWRVKQAPGWQARTITRQPFPEPRQPKKATTKPEGLRGVRD